MAAPSGAHALHQACRAGDYDSAKRLLGEGASLLTLWEGRSPLTLAVESDPPDLRLIDLLLRYGARPRSIPLGAAGPRTDDAFDAALRCTRRRDDVLVRLLRNTPANGWLHNAARLFQAAADFSLDVMREVLLCVSRCGDNYGGGSALGTLRSIDAWFAAVDTHGLAAVEAASILPLMISTLGARSLGNVWQSYDMEPIYDAPAAHAAFLTQLALSGVATDADLAFLIAMDTDLALVNAVADAGCPHPYRDRESAGERLLPRFFSAVGNGKLADLIATLSNDELNPAVNAHDRFGQHIISRLCARLNVADVRALLRRFGHSRLWHNANAMCFVPTFRLLTNGKRVPAFRYVKEMTSTASLVLTALAEHYRGLRDTGSAPAELESNATVQDHTRRACDTLEALMDFEASIANLDSLDVVRALAVTGTVQRNNFRAAIATAFHAVCAPDLPGRIALSSRAALLEFCARRLCSDVNTRVCDRHTPLSLLLACLFDGGAGIQPSTVPFTDRGAERLLPLLLVDPTGAGINWKVIAPATAMQRADPARSGHGALTSLGSLLGHHFRLPEALRQWRPPPGAAAASKITGFSYWPRVEQLSQRPWAASAREELTAAARTVGAWWLPFVQRLAAARGRTQIAARGCVCRLCTQAAGAPGAAALALQHTAVAFSVDGCVGRGDDYFSCAVVCDPAALSDAHVRALWPALLHAAAFYRDPDGRREPPACPHAAADRAPALPPLAQLGCRLLWVNVLSAAVRLRDGDALRLALWLAPLCAGDYSAGPVRTMAPLFDSVEGVVQLVAAGVARRRLPHDLLAGVMGAVEQLEDAGRVCGVTAASSGFARSDVHVADFQPAGRLLARGQHRAACALLHAGARVDDPALLLHLAPAVPQSSAAATGGAGHDVPLAAVSSGARKRRVQAAVGAAGWARRTHALAARARARWEAEAAAAAAGTE